jgi:hypothetical protein
MTCGWSTFQPAGAGRHPRRAPSGCGARNGSDECSLFLTQGVRNKEHASTAVRTSVGSSDGKVAINRSVTSAKAQACGRQLTLRAARPLLPSARSSARSAQGVAGDCSSSDNQRSSGHLRVSTPRRGRRPQSRRNRSPSQNAGERLCRASPAEHVSHISRHMTNPRGQARSRGSVWTFHTRSRGPLCGRSLRLGPRRRCLVVRGRRDHG